MSHFLKLEVTQERCTDLFIELPDGVEWDELSKVQQKHIALQASLDVQPEEWAESNDLIVDWYVSVEPDEAAQYGTYSVTQEDIEPF